MLASLQRPIFVIWARPELKRLPAAFLNAGVLQVDEREVAPQA